MSTTVRELIRNRDYLTLLVGQFVAKAGSSANTVGLTLYVLKFDNPVAGMGTLAILLMVPWIVIGPFAGVLADRVAKRTIIIACDAARGILCVCLLFAQNQVIFFLIVLALAIFDVAFSPAISGFLPAVVKREQIAKAGSLYAGAGQVAQLGGPALGGLLVATLGFNSVFVINGGAYLAAAVFSCFISVRGKMVSSEDAAEERFWAQLRGGVDYIRGHWNIMFVVLFFAVTSFAFGSFPILVPNYLTGDLKVSDQIYGVFTSVSGLGAILGAALVPTLLVRVKATRLMVLSTGLFGVVIAVVAMVSNVPSALALYCFCGVVSSVVNVTYSVFLQRTVDANFLGRVFSLNLALSNAATLIAMVLVTSLVGLSGVSAWIVIFGVALAVMAGIGFLVVRRAPDEPSKLGG